MEGAAVESGELARDREAQARRERLDSREKLALDALSHATPRLSALGLRTSARFCQNHMMNRSIAVLALLLLANVALSQQVALIPEIQGKGLASPLENQQVETYGLVTMKKSNGFFMQLPAPGDGDPSTSDGVFVFTSSSPPVTVGDVVTVRGTVKEFNGLTEIQSNPYNGVLSSSGNPLPAPVTVTRSVLHPAGSPTQLEHLEGMRVAASRLITCGPTDGHGDVATVLPDTARPFLEPGIDVRLVLPPGAPSTVPRFDSNPERLFVDTNGRAGSQASNYTSYVQLTNVTGVLDFASGEYRLITDGTHSATGNVSVLPLSPAAPADMTIASFNLENFLSSSASYTTKLLKASRAIRDVLRLPDIIGVQEAGDLDALQSLAARINADAGLVPGYEAYLVEADGVGGDSDIDVGFLVNAGRVLVVSVAQEGADATFTNPSTGQQQILNDRPPLVLESVVTVSESPLVQFPVTVIVNHLRSLINVGQDPGDGPNVRAKRRAQAEFLAELVQGRQAADPEERIVLVGDFNAFQFNDGYVDVMGTITGKPAPASAVTLASADLVNPDLSDLVAMVEASQRYSYVYLGNAEVLDHVIVNASALPFAEGLAYARNGADFPDSYFSDVARPERVSDHDIPMSYFRTPVPVRFDVTAPASARPGVPFTVRITARDASGDTAVDYVGTVALTSSDSGAVLPSELTFTAADAGERSEIVTLQAEGVWTISAGDVAAPTLSGMASVTVDSSLPVRRRPVRPGR